MRFDLTSTLLRSLAPHPRTIGRYNVSDIYGIVKGYLTVENFLNPVVPSARDAVRMWQGRWKHKQVQELLALEGYIIEEKREHTHILPDGRGCLIVGKTDAMHPDPKREIIEIKTSKFLFHSARDSFLHQGKLYCSLFERPEAIIVQPVIVGDTIQLKHIAQVTRNDKWYEQEIEKVIAFHQKLTDHVLSSVPS